MFQPKNPSAATVPVVSPHHFHHHHFHHHHVHYLQKVTTEALSAISEILDKIPSLSAPEMKQKNIDKAKQNPVPAQLVQGLKLIHENYNFSNAPISAQTLYDGIVASRTPLMLCKIIIFLQSTTLFSLSNINDIFLHAPGGSALENILNILKAKGLLEGSLAQENFNASLHAKNINWLDLAVQRLDATGLLSSEMGQTVFSEISGHIDPLNVALAYIALFSKGKLSKDRLRRICSAVFCNSNFKNKLEVNSAIEFLLSTNCDVETFKYCLNRICSRNDALQVIETLKEIFSMGLFDRTIVDSLLKSSHPKSVNEAMQSLRSHEIFSEKKITAFYFERIVKSPAPQQFVLALIFLIEHPRPLTPEIHALIIDKIAMHLNPMSAVEGVHFLFEKKLVTAELVITNLQIVLDNPNPLNTANLMYFLSKNKLLRLICPDIISSCQNVVDARAIFDMLQSTKLLTPHTHSSFLMKAVLTHKNLPYLKEILKLCISKKLFVDKSALSHLETILQLDHAPSLLSLLGLLSTKNWLTKASLDTVLQYSAILISERDLWRMIPFHQLTKERFDAMIIICREHQGEVELGIRRLTDYIEHWFNLIRDPEAQTTHTASVNQSASASAIKLFRRYGDIINERGVDAIAKELYSELLNLSKHPRSIIVSRCIERFQSDRVTTVFVDPISKISVKKLLALFFLAINDKENRIGTLDDAYSSLMEGLYEIQRDGNLTKKGFDNGSQDEFICPSGTFNKLVEKLVGIHPDAEMSYVTKTGLATKIKVVIKEELMAFLEQLPESQDREESDARNELLNELKEGIPSNVWEAISTTISDRIFDEFGTLFHNKEDKAFLAVIDAGQSFSLSEAVLDTFRRSSAPESLMKP